MPLLCTTFTCCVLSARSFIQPVQEVRRKIRQDQRTSYEKRSARSILELGNRIPTCSQEGLSRLECHRLEVIYAGPGTRDDHSILPTDLVDSQRVVRSDLCCVGNNVEVWHAGFDHNDVSTLIDISSLQRKSTTMNRDVTGWTHNSSTGESFSAGWELVALPVAEGRGAPSGFTVMMHEARVQAATGGGFTGTARTGYSRTWRNSS